MRFSKLTIALLGTFAATSFAAPAKTFFDSHLSARGPATQCGEFAKVEEEGIMPAYANGHYENVEVATHMISFINYSCGICMVFRERDAQGDVMWSGGPGDHAGADKVRGGQSYFCIYGFRATASTKKELVNKTIEARETAEVADAPMEARRAAKVTDALVEPRYAEHNATDPNDPRYCGFYGADVPNEGQKFFSALKTGYHEDTEKNSVMTFFNNQKCGFCIVFKERGAQGDILWSGGPTNTDAAKGGQSYWCY